LTLVFAAQLQRIVCALECVRRVEEITGQHIPFYKVDLLHTDALREVFRKVASSCVCLCTSSLQLCLSACKTADFFSEFNTTVDSVIDYF